MIWEEKSIDFDDDLCHFRPKTVVSFHDIPDLKLNEIHWDFRFRTQNSMKFIEI